MKKLMVLAFYILSFAGATTWAEELVFGLPVERAGTERSGGGSELRSRFFNITSLAISQLLNEETAKFLSAKEISLINEMKMQLRKSSLEFVSVAKEILKDRNGKPVDMTNHPSEMWPMIRIQEEPFRSMPLRTVIQMGFHELIGLTNTADELDGLLWGLSNKYTQMVYFKVLEKFRALIPNEFIDNESNIVIGIFELGKYIKTLMDSANVDYFLTNRCEQVNPTFGKGQCLVIYENRDPLVGRTALIERRPLFIHYLQDFNILNSSSED